MHGRVSLPCLKHENSIRYVLVQQIYVYMHMCKYTCTFTCICIVVRVLFDAYMYAHMYIVINKPHAVRVAGVVVMPNMLCSTRANCMICINVFKQSS